MPLAEEPLALLAAALRDPSSRLGLSLVARRGVRPRSRTLVSVIRTRCNGASENRWLRCLLPGWR